ncbi:MAG: hypothetical protein LBF27_21625 [Sphingobacterium sp.]|jgi:hypothetical protein|nr:hypothetical protein [Sphingobacterium sp.]
MKTLKSRVIAGVSALALVAGSFFIVDAMENNAVPKSTTKIDELQEWHFKGATDPKDNDITDPLQYEQGASTSCNAIKQTACNINAPESSTNPGQPDLTAMVGTTGRTVAERVQDAIDAQAFNETVDSFRSN